MVGALLARFDLAQLDARVVRGAVEHFDEQLLRRKMAARAGREVAAARQELHRAVVDLLIARHRPLRRPSALGEGGRVEDDEVVLHRLLCERREEVKHVRRHALHHIAEPVALGVAACALHGELRYVHRRHMLCPTARGVERERTRVREAVEHRPPARELRHGEPVILLVEEKARFLPVFKVHGIADAAFRDIRLMEVGDGLTRQGIPSLPLLHALLFAQGDVVALIDARDLLPVGAQCLDEQPENHRLDAIHAETQHLRHEDIFKPVDREPGEVVRLAEDNPAAAAVLLAHHGLAVVPCVLHAPRPERAVKAVVRVAREEPHADHGAAVIKARAEVAPLPAEHVHKRAVLGALRRLRHLPGVDPRVAVHEGALALGRDGESRVGSLRFHLRRLPFCRSIQLLKFPARRRRRGTLPPRRGRMPPTRGSPRWPRP